MVQPKLPRDAETKKVLAKLHYEMNKLEAESMMIVQAGSPATLAAAPSDVSTAAGQPLMSEAPFGSGLGSALLGSAAGSAAS